MSVGHGTQCDYSMDIKISKSAKREVFECIAGDLPDGAYWAMAEALQMGGYIPKAAVDAEIKATKYHLEDMRKLVFKE